MREYAPKTAEQYQYLLKRIHAAIGEVPLEKLRPDHLFAFYDELKKNDARVPQGKAYATKDINAIRKEQGLSIRELTALTGLSTATINAAGQGQTIYYYSAEKSAGRSAAKQKSFSAPLIRTVNCRAILCITTINSFAPSLRAQKLIQHNLKLNLVKNC